MMLLARLCALTLVIPPALSLVRHSSNPRDQLQRLIDRIDRLPTDSKILILLRGQTFRVQDHDERIACHEFSRPSQLNNSLSVLEHVIEPLEDLGNQVDVIVTDEPCSMTPEVSEIFGKRVLATKSFRTGGQAEDYRQALNSLNEKCGGVEKVQQTYDYIMVFRHDLRFLLTLADWAADWSTINFFARCEVSAARSLGGKNCVHDTIHVVPGKYYEVFNGVIGSDRVRVNVQGEDRLYSCFALSEDPIGHGHACYYPMLTALQNVSKDATLGVVYHSRFRVRSQNDILDLKLPRADMPPPQEWDAVESELGKRLRRALERAGKPYLHHK